MMDKMKIFEIDWGGKDLVWDKWGVWWLLGDGGKGIRDERKRKRKRVDGDFKEERYMVEFGSVN